MVASTSSGMMSVDVVPLGSVLWIDIMVGRDLERSTVRKQPPSESELSSIAIVSRAFIYTLAIFMDSVFQS